MYFTTKTYKIITISISLICGILGILLAWYGIWLLQSIENSQLYHDEKINGILIITLGVIIICSAIYGIVVILMEKKNLLTGLAVLLVVLMVIQFILISIRHIAVNDVLPKKLAEGFDELFEVKYQKPNATLSSYEEMLKCCGKNSAEDYFLLDKVPPASCCLDHNCAIIHNLYTIGCEQKYKNYMQQKTKYFNLLSWLLITFEFVGSIFACFLLDSLRNHRDRLRLFN